MNCPIAIPACYHENWLIAVRIDWRIVPVSLTLLSIRVREVTRPGPANTFCI